MKRYVALLFTYTCISILQDPLFVLVHIFVDCSLQQAPFQFQSFEEKVANVTLAFELMQDAGLPKPKARPEDIVNLDLKSTLRVLYNLFTKYKHLS